MSVPRRTFLLAGGALVAGAAPPADQIVLGVIGSGSRGTFVMGVFQKDPALRVGAICDVYEPNLENAVSAASKATGTNPRSIAITRNCWPTKTSTPSSSPPPSTGTTRWCWMPSPPAKTSTSKSPSARRPKRASSWSTPRPAPNRSSRSACSAAATTSIRRAARSSPAATSAPCAWCAPGGSITTSAARPPPNSMARSIGNSGRAPPPHRPFDANRFRQWRFYSDYAGGILADQGAHVFDGIHMLMGAGYPLAVNASAGKPHKAGVDQPESVVAIAEYPEDFIGVFTVNYAAMQYKLRNDQMNQLDGDQARMDIGREELQGLPAKAPKTQPAIDQEIREGLRLGHRPARAELPGVRPHPPNRPPRP